jgi:uncharacterized SAM-binding protein YcdF (DUF218 family)
VLALVVLVPVLYLVVSFLQVWEASRRDYDGAADAIVVLGAAQYAGNPSPVLRARLDHAALLYHQGRAPLIVLTGGAQDGDITTEAMAGYEYLRATGIPDDHLLLEVDGTSTYESLAASARFLQERGVRQVILVSDPYHAKRVSMVASEVGLEPHVSPTDGAAPFRRLARETLAVGAGRVLGFRRLERLVR